MMGKGMVFNFMFGAVKVEGLRANMMQFLFNVVFIGHSKDQG